MAKFVCDRCGLTFTTRGNLMRHIKSGVRCARELAKSVELSDRVKVKVVDLAGNFKKETLKFPCPKPDCKSAFTRQDNLRKHIRDRHSDKGPALICGRCPLVFHDRAELTAHRETHTMESEFGLTQSAHRRACTVRRMQFEGVDAGTIGAALAKVRPVLKKLLEQLNTEHQSYKAMFVLQIRFSKQVEDMEEEVEGVNVVHISLRNTGVKYSTGTNIEECLDEAFREMNLHCEEYLGSGSGWNFDRAMYFDVEAAQCIPLNGRCNMHRVVWDRGQRRDVIVVGSGANASLEEVAENGLCFYRAVACHFVKQRELEGKKVGETAEYVKRLDEYIARNMKFGSGEKPLSALAELPAMEVNRVSKFEADNEHLDLAVHVIYQDEDAHFFPVYCSRRSIKAKNIVVLILCFVADPLPPDVLEHQGQQREQQRRESRRQKGVGEQCVLDEAEGNRHYVYVPDPGLLFSSTRTRPTRRYQRQYHERRTPRDEEDYDDEDDDDDEGVGDGFIDDEDAVEWEESGGEEEEKEGGSEVKKEAATRERRRRYPCFNCMSLYSSPAALANHQHLCFNNECQNVKVPFEGKTHEYQGGYKEYPLAYFLAYDFECKQVKVNNECACNDEEAKKTCGHNTKRVFKQTAIAYGYVLIRRDGGLVESGTYVGDDAAEKFVELLMRLEEKYVAPVVKEPKKLHRTEITEKAFREDTHCVLCKKRLGKVEDKRRHHDHLNGGFVGIAHNACNLKSREYNKLVAFAHNFTGYDSHLVIQGLAVAAKKLNIKCLETIAVNREKFKMLRISRTVLLDSMAFLPAALQKLVENLVASRHSFPLLKQWLEEKKQSSESPADTEKKLKLLCRKGSYPYEEISSIEYLKETRALPPKKLFFSRLSERDISDQDYAHAQTVWETFECKDMQEYTELYCISDCLLLAEAVGELRDNVLEEFQLDIVHYFSLAMLSKDIMFKTTGESVQYVHDIDMINVFRNGLRGGLCFAANRYFDPVEQTAASGNNSPFSLLYLDANSLYGTAMQFPMPVGEYKWLSEEEQKAYRLPKWATEGGDITAEKASEHKYGHVLEVDMKYPKKLHLAHNSFPLAPHHMVVTEKHLSPYAKNCLDVLKEHSPASATKYKSRKLISSFLRRKKYLVHELNLALYVKQGLVVTKVHRVMKFRQKPFIAPYIQMCAKKRAAALTKTRGDLYKLIANVIYGKMIENGANRADCVFNTTREQCIKRQSHPRFKSFTVCGPDLSVSHLKKSVLHLNQMWAIGFTILELSKLFMQQMYYNHIRPAFNNQCSIVMSDTDSFLMAVGVKHPDEGVKRLMHVMDTSNYDEKHPLYSTAHKNALGKMKNECPKYKLTQACAVKAKAYSYKDERGEEMYRLKGVRRAVVEQLRFEGYAQCVRPGRVAKHRIRQHSLISKSHNIHLISQDKQALNSFDDKLFLACSIHTHPYGSYYAKLNRLFGICILCQNPDILT